MKIITLIALLPLVVRGQNPVVPVLNALFEDQDKIPGDVTQTFNLNEFFGTEEIRDNAVRLTAEWLYLDGSTGLAEIDFLLFRDRTPITVDNFLGYVNRGDYTNMVVHRLIPDFVIQGGGFTIVNEDGAPSLGNVNKIEPIQNEFGVSNTLATISMAKLGGNPDSATSEWFISTGANSDNLDFQNEGFTVFGRVSQGSFANAMALNNRDDFEIFNLGGALNNAPLIRSTTQATFVAERFYRFSSVAEVPLPSGQAGTDVNLTYSFASGDEGDGPVLDITGSTLTVSYPEATVGGRKVVVVQAEDSVGNKVVDTFAVLLTADYDSWRKAVFSMEDAANDSVSGPMADSNGDGVTNLISFAQGLPVDENVEAIVKVPRITRLSTNTIIEIETPFIDGVDFEVETSDGLENWSDIATTQSTTIGANGITVRFTIARSLADAANSAYRIRYSLN